MSLLAVGDNRYTPSDANKAEQLVSIAGVLLIVICFCEQDAIEDEQRSARGAKTGDETSSELGQGASQHPSGADAVG